jgi:hypothetical protein
MLNYVSQGGVNDVKLINAKQLSTSVLKIPKITTLAIFKPIHGPLKKGACEVR